MVGKRETPRELYSKCVESEERLNDKGVWERIKLGIVQSLAFPPLFESEPASGAAPAQGEDEASLDTLTRAAFLGQRHRDLVELLGKCSSNEARLLVLARWLKQEGVCQPREFLPRKIYQKSARNAFGQRKPFSATDWRYVFIVDAWKPYFERLVGDLRTIEKGTKRHGREQLLSTGFEEGAVDLVLASKKRAVLPAVCEWLESHRKIGRHVLLKTRTPDFPNVTTTVTEARDRSFIVTESRSRVRDASPWHLLGNGHNAAHPRKLQRHTAKETNANPRRDASD